MGRINLRAKLMAIFCVAALAFLTILLTSSFTSAQVGREIREMREQYVPKLEMGARLENQFEHLAKTFQEAVAARDVDGLDRARDLKEDLLKNLTSVSGSVGSDKTDVLRRVVEDYYVVGDDVSRRLIAQETGERVVERMAVMQAKQKAVAEVLAKTVSFKRDDLANAFASIERSQSAAARARLAISSGCLTLVIVLSFWLLRGVIRSLTVLNDGFERFGKGLFEPPIVLSGHDEFSVLARQANKMAENLKIAMRQLEATLALTQDQNAAVQEASRLKSEFLANMSHELRTPLNAIIGFAQLLHDGEVRAEMPEFREFLGDILTSGQHLLQLINDVLDLSKVEAGKFEFYPEAVDLGALVREVLAVLRTTAASKGVQIEQQVDHITDVELDGARFKQVLYNYISNAIKFSPQGGRIHVRILAEVPALFRLEVEDSGVGIAQEDLPRLFVEFQQLDAGSTKKHSGTGLGLALTKRLIEAQSGHVGVSSTLGKGSTFYAVLPRRPTRGRPALLPQSIPGTHPQSGKVLVVEDNERDQQAIVRALTSAGFAIETASTGAQALTKCREESFDAITLDLVLSDVGGLQVLQEIRQSAHNRDVPVIVITVVTEYGQVAGFAIHDVLPKPLNEEALLQSLQRAGVVTDASREVLIVDDNGGSRRLMSAAMTKLGYKTIAVSDGADGLRLVRQSAPNAVVLDLMMPGMDGFEFLEHFRQIPGCSQIPVIVWTAKDLTQDDYQRLQASAQAVVAKGQGASALAQEIHRFLGTGKRERTADG